MQEIFLFNASVDDLKSHIGAIKGDLVSLLPHWNVFCENLGPTAQFWSMYVEMVLIMKRYITAERAGIWEDHLTEVTYMIPFIISA